MQKRNKNNVTNINFKLKAFTLVELVVVILIISILGTIAFMSFQGYSRDARDSKRTADIGNIKKSLELYFVDSGEYPSPDSFTTITYSGGIDNVWYQGNVGDRVVINLKGLNKKPLDPLFKTPYIYSVTNSYEEYQVLGLYEGNVAYNNVINMVNAATTSLTPKLDGNYNGLFVKTDHYIIPTPSIITSEPLSGGILLLNSSNIRSQVTNNGINIPQNVLANSSTGGLDINFSVYTGSISSKSSIGEMVNAVKSIQNAFTGTTIGKTQDKIKYVLSQSTTSQLINLGNTTILKGRIPLVFNGGGSNIIPLKSVLNCGTISGQIIYGTADGTDVGLICSDDIIVCNGTTGSGYTISACNVGATAVALSNNSNKITSYGGLYQWGNNYNSRGNQFTDGDIFPTTVTQILTAQNYTTYTSNAFVEGSSDWTNQDYTGLLRSAQWNVCPTGYHISTNTEWNSIFALLGNQVLYGITNQLKIPAAGYRNNNNFKLYSQGFYGRYWSSSPNGTTGYLMGFKKTNISPSYNYFTYGRAYGLSVRCFKN